MRGQTIQRMDKHRLRLPPDRLEPTALDRGLHPQASPAPRSLQDCRPEAHLKPAPVSSSSTSPALSATSPGLDCTGAEGEALHCIQEASEARCCAAPRHSCLIRSEAQRAGLPSPAQRFCPNHPLHRTPLPTCRRSPWREMATTTPLNWSRNCSSRIVLPTRGEEPATTT